MLPLPDFDRNQLLGALPAEAFQLLQPHLQRVLLPLGCMLYEPGVPLQHAYFPTTAIVSLQYVTESGASIEVAGVGLEGMVGVALFLGGGTTPGAAVVQTAGYAFRLEASLLKREFDRAGAMQHLLLRYTKSLMVQIAQTAACNRHHMVEQQLCRWLLLTLDRTPWQELVMTQQLVANMLGVRREGVTSAAGKLQEAGLIRYRRGHITVLDRVGLERHACECYAVIRAELGYLEPAGQQRAELALAIRKPWSSV